MLPLGGDLRAGGRFLLDGNAAGVIIECKPPYRLQLTLECGDLQGSLVVLELAPVGDDATELVLRHTVADDGQCAQYVPAQSGSAGTCRWRCSLCSWPAAMSRAATEH